MSVDPIGFAVIYRWHLRDGHAERFRQAWRTMTRLLMTQRGALGSRLHRAEDGDWVAYAQWPSKAAWERSQNMDSPDPAASATMREAILKSSPPILLDPVDDHLVLPSRE